MTYVILEEDSRGDLVEIKYFCSAWCAPPGAGAWPGGMETDSNVYCTECQDLMWEGMTQVFRHRECLVVPPCPGRATPRTN